MEMPDTQNCQNNFGKEAQIQSHSNCKTYYTGAVINQDNVVLARHID